MRKYEIEEHAKKLELREKIKPILSVVLEKNKIKIKNVSNNTALSIYNDTKVIKDSLSPKEEFVIETVDNCVPSSVFLSYEDIERNCMSCEFILADEKMYVLRDFYYIALNGEKN